MTEEEQVLRRQMRESFHKLADKPGEEMVYATCYQQLVRLGVEPQLRRKYRP